MTDALPDPLVPPEVDLRDFQFTPIFRARLFGSSFHARSTDAEWRAGVTLWLKSWDQVPAGTLPDDDIDLCRLAEFGRDMKGWHKARTGALHGWRKCSDGRLHHPVVAQGVLEAWEKRSSAKRKGIAGALKRWGSTTEPDSTSNASAIAQAMPGDSKGQGQGIEGIKASAPRKQPAHRKTQLPENFAISDAVREWACEKGHTDLHLHLESFISKVKAKGYTYVDWDHAFRNAITGDWAGLKKGAHGSQKFDPVAANLELMRQ